MAATTHLDIVSAEKAIFSGLVEQIIVPGELGELGVARAFVPGEHEEQAVFAVEEFGKQDGAIGLKAVVVEARDCLGAAGEVFGPGLGAPFGVVLAIEDDAV